MTSDTEEAVARVEESLPEPLSSHARFITAALSYYDDKPAEQDVLLAWHTILTALERAERERDGALREMGRYAAEAGEAKGRLEMSEAAGIVDMWREHAQSAEAALADLKTEVVEVVRQAGDFANALADADLDETAADGGVTVGMVFQQQARTVYGPRARDLLAKLKVEG